MIKKILLKINPLKSHHFSKFFNYINNYHGMDIEEEFFSEIKNEIEIMNELE